MLIEDAGDVPLEELAGAARIGVTAGASAPAHLVDHLLAALAGLGPLTVWESVGVEENLQFTLPREVT
jgi:4-hydroxy-3-methylbut-2-enyl diphosphate reductase